MRLSNQLLMAARSEKNNLNRSRSSESKTDEFYDFVMLHDQLTFCISFDINTIKTGRVPEELEFLFGNNLD